MATVNIPTVLTLTATFVDSEQNTRTASTNRPASTTTTFADILSEAQAFANVLDPLSLCKITSMNASFGGPVEDPGTEANPALSDVERKGSFVFLAANGSVSKLEIPGITSDVVQRKTNVIDDTNADVLALIAYMTGASPSVTSYGVALTELKSAKKIHRKSSKG